MPSANYSFQVFARNQLGMGLGSAPVSQLTDGQYGWDNNCLGNGSININKQL